MRFLVPSFLAFLLALPAAAQSPQRSSSPTGPQQQLCSLSGTVVKLAGSEPLRSATVELQSLEDRTHTVSVATDAGGHFQIKGIDPGRYRLRVTRNGFVTQEYGQKTPSDPGSDLRLSAGQDLKDLLFRLIPWSVIAGRILNEDGEPLPWAQVSALREVYMKGKRKLSPEVTVPTNDLGEYRLFGLRPGRYFVSAKYKPGVQIVGQQEIQTGLNDDSERGYAETYYPGSPDPARASTITVKAGDEIPSVEILLRPVTVFRIRGRVYNTVSAKRSGAGVNIVLQPRNTGLSWSFPAQQGHVEKPDGSFEINDVLPGSYVLSAVWFDEGKRYLARQSVEVGNADVEGINLTIAPGVAVSGHVTWDGKPSLERDELTVYVSAVDLLMSFVSPAKITGGDLFVLRDVSEATYRLDVYGQSKDCYLKAVRYGTRDGLDDGFTVIRGTQASLEVTISSHGASVQGTITDTDKVPAAGLWVVLVPDEAHRGQSRLYKHATTDQFGHFDLRGIAPGDYKLFSWEEVEDGAWEDPDFLKPFEEKGEKVSLQEGDVKTVDIVAIKTKSSQNAWHSPSFSPGSHLCLLRQGRREPDQEARAPVCDRRCGRKDNYRRFGPNRDSICAVPSGPDPHVSA
jgi:Carboxypeptidase regulatory-like domain